MILLSFIFLVPFVFLLSSLPASLSDGMAGYWVSAAWTLNPVGPANLPLPILMGKAALFLFPFGSTTFRMNLAGAVLTALAPVLAFRLFHQTRPQPAPGPTILELDDERKWATASLMALSLWVLSPPFVRAGTHGLVPATNLFFSLLALEQFLSWQRTLRGSTRHWIHGVGMAAAGGLALTLDLRWVLLLPALFFLRRSKRATQGKNPFLFPSLIGPLFLFSFLAPWVMLAAFQTATADQMMRVLPSTIRNGLWPISDFLGGDLSGFLLVGGLFFAYFLAWGLKTVSARFPKAATLTFLMVLVTQLILFFLHPAPLPSTESETNDVFRSLPSESVLLCSRPETIGAATYAQMVLGKRRDIHLVLKKSSGIPVPAENHPLYIELRAPIGNPEEELPAGFARRFTHPPLNEPSSILAQMPGGQIPLLLAESQAPSFSLGLAHRQRGDAFARLQVADEAEEEYLTAVAIDPKNGSIMTALGRLLSLYDNGKRATAAFVRAARLQPKSDSIDSSSLQ